jgi:hypothetical protein
LSIIIAEACRGSGKVEAERNKKTPIVSAIGVFVSGTLSQKRKSTITPKQVMAACHRDEAFVQFCDEADGRSQLQDTAAGSGTAVRKDAVCCFGFAAAVTGGSGTVRTGAARKHDGSSAGRPTAVISRVAKDGWTIATVNGPTASGSFRLA